MKIRLESGEIVDSRRVTAILKKIGRPTVLTSREQANQMTSWCLRNNSPIEEFHGRGDISQDEMKSMMIEASARIDFLLRKNRLFRMTPASIFNFAFKTAITNNCSSQFGTSDWASLRHDVYRNLARIISHRKASRRFYMLFLATNLFYGSAASWDTRPIFDGHRLIEDRTS